MRLQAQRERRLSQKCITILDVRLAWKLFACIVEKPRKQRYTKIKYVQSIQRIKTPGAGREGNGMGKIKILLVDDEREEREGISWLIEKYEYPLEIMQASNGKEALQCIEKTKIDILFTDVKMPIMDGLELAKKVHDTRPEIKIIIFSAYGEFSYAKQALEANAVSYLLKPIEIEEFQKIMVSVIESVQRENEEGQRLQTAEVQNRRNLLYKIFSSAKIEQEEAEKAEQILNLGTGKHCRILDIEFTENFFEEHEEIFLQFLKMYLGENTSYLEMYPNEAYVMVRDARFFTGNELEKQVQKILRDLQVKTRSEAAVIISEVVENAEKLEKQLEQMHQIQAELFGYGNQIVSTRGYYSETELYAQDAERAARQMMQAIESMDTELIARQNEQLMKVVASLDKVSKIYLQNLLYSIIKAIYDKVPKIEFEEALALAEALFRAKSLKNMMEVYEQAVEKMLSFIQGEDQDESRIIQKIKNLIEKEYAKDISLNYVAENVNLTPAYVSYIFKKETGQTLVKYVTDIKMMKARKMLEEGTLKIVQVAKTCGYENQSYFNRLFKNYYGVTPKQLREKL